MIYAFLDGKTLLQKCQLLSANQYINYYKYPGGGLVTKSCPTLETTRNCSPQAPLSRGFSRQEHWSGLSCPPLRDLPNPGTEPVSLMSPALAGGFFTTRTMWEAQWVLCLGIISLTERDKYTCEPTSGPSRYELLIKQT